MGVKSPVWLFYENTLDGKYKCKICGHKIKDHNGSTSSYRQHILAKHVRSNEAKFLIYKKTKDAIIRSESFEDDQLDTIKPIESEDYEGSYTKLLHKYEEWKNRCKVVCLVIL